MYLMEMKNYYVKEVEIGMGLFLHVLLLPVVIQVYQKMVKDMLRISCMKQTPHSAAMEKMDSKIKVFHAHLAPK